MSNTVNLGNGKWAIKDSELLGYSLTDDAELIALTLDVSRASSGTRVNASGLIETVAETGSQLITNGNFATDSDWTYGADWTISNGVASASGSAFSSLSPTTLISVSAGVTYKITFDLNYTSGTLRTKIGGTQTGYLGYSAGNNFVEIFLTSVDTTNFSLVSANLNGSIDNVSVVEYNDENLARIDYTDSTDGVLLTEPQSINLIAESEDFSDSYWAKTNASVVSGQAAPSVDNPTSAFKAVNNSTNGNVARTIYVTNGVEYATSVFVKKGNSDTFRISHSNIGDTVFNLVTGVVVSGNGTIDNIGNGWFRCTKIQTGASIGYFVLYYGIPNSLVNDYFYIFGAQVEEQSYVTSYMPTYGQIASRASDVVTNGGEAINFNSEEGVLFAEIAALGDSGVLRVISISDGTDQNRIQIRYESASNSISVLHRVSGISNVYLTEIVSDETDFIKLAFKWKSGDFAFWINGVEEAVSTYATMFPINTLTELSYDDSTGVSKFYGKTKNLQVFKEALTDAQLITLTTI